MVMVMVQGDETVMIARRRILAGQEVTDFYGAHFFQSSRAERQGMLGFPCQCRPCSENWPLIRNLQTSRVLTFQSKFTVRIKERILAVVDI